MEDINWIELLPYFGVAALGTLAHIVAKLAKLEQNARFSFKEWLKKNKYTTFLSIILSLGGVFVLQSTGGLSLVAVFLMGYTGDSMVKNGGSAMSKNKERNG